LAGIKEKVAPRGALSGDAHAADHGPLPTTWDQVLQQLEQSSVARVAPDAEELQEISLMEIACKTVDKRCSDVLSTSDARDFGY
jgi:glutamine synthetase